MIISVSRRTDIPAFYYPWFLDRLKAGEVLVRNPMNYRQVSRILLNRENVDGFVFWSKFPAAMLHESELLKEYSYYIQFTLNGYGSEIEQGLPAQEQRIEVFRALSGLLGQDRVIWRYDPIFLNGDYTLEWHRRQFEQLTSALAPYTGRCVISFLDMYQRIRKKADELEIQIPTEADMRWIGEEFGRIAAAHRLKLETCAEDISLEAYGISHGACIDTGLLSGLSGKELSVKKDKNQRPACGCGVSVDIGCYDSCMYRCVYCYAAGGRRGIDRSGAYDRGSPFLCSSLRMEDIVKTKHL